MNFKKNIIIVIWIAIIIGCAKTEMKKHEKLSFLKSNVKFKNDSLKIVTKISDDFICLYNNRIYKYSAKEDKVTKVTGGSGIGPGEFRNINLIKVQNNKILIADWELHRISEFDFDLNFVSSFLVNSSYTRDIITKNDIYYLLGNFYMSDKKRAPLLEIFDKKHNKLNYGAYVDLKAERCFKKHRFSLLNSAFCINNDSLFIVNSALGNLYSYDILNKEFHKHKINFKGYIQPSKINVRKNKKDKTLLKIGLQNLSAAYFFFSPQQMWFNKNLNMFIITYAIPYQIQKQNNFDKMYTHVFFNKKFEEICEIKSNFKIIDVFSKNNKSYLFVENLTHNIYDSTKHFEINGSKYQKILVEKK